MKPFSIVVTGEPNDIKTLINCISYGPDELITHRYQTKDSGDNIEVQMNFGSLQVDEDHRIDFFGGNDEELFEFVNGRPENGFKGMIIILNSDDSKRIENFESELVKHESYLRKYALAVGVSGSDYTFIKQAEEQVRNCLSTMETVAPTFSIDPENKEEVSLLVESLLCLAHPGINDNKSGKPSFNLSDEIE